MILYTLPDGTIATNIKTYIDAWHAYALPICEHTGLSLLAYDPNIVVGTQDYKLVICLPKWFVERLSL